MKRSERPWKLVVIGALCVGLLSVSMGLRSRLWPEAREEARPANPVAREEDYLRWLEERSMLDQARRSARKVSGNSVQWRHAYGRPRPREAVRRASVWLLDYPGSVIPRPGQSVLATWGDPELWDA
jgi:hypothetical protein